MNWPPVKAWTSKINLNGKAHFVAINYGGVLLKRWVLLMSVLDSNVVVKVPWSQLVDLSYWEAGWYEVNNRASPELVNNKSYVETTNFSHPSIDSGLTIPISQKTIRPWFNEI